MMPAAKMLDPMIGIDFHLIQPPGAPPLLMPHAAIGIVFDPFDLIPKIGADVFVGGLPRAQAGTAGLMLPHVPMGGVFVKPPAHDFEIFMGSKTVSADDEPFSYLALPALSCQCIGIPPIPRKKKKKPKTSLGLVLPTSVVLAIPCGVFVEGPPTISLTALAFRAGIAGLGKLVKKAKGARRWKALSDRVHRFADKLCDRLKLGDVARNRVHRGICTVTGHPVDVATGKVFTEFRDLILPGPLPFTFERVWFSTSTYRGPLGHGWHHSYDSALYVTAELVLLRTSDGRLVPFPALAEDEEYFSREERCTLERHASGYRLHSAGGLTQHFGRVGADQTIPTSMFSGEPALQRLLEVSNADGHRVRLRYDASGALTEIVDSAGRHLRFEYDPDGRMTELRAPHPDLPDEWFSVSSYSYDQHGNLSSMTDALGHVVHYHYAGQLLVRETDRNGLSFHFDYDGSDETARCVRTFGDDGILARQLRYEATRTVVTDSLGHDTMHEHRGGLVVRTTNARGAVTSTQYEYNRPVALEDALGGLTKLTYDERGNLLEQIEPDGARSRFVYDERDRLLESVNAIGARWSYRYDEANHPIEQLDPLGRKTELHYVNGLLVRSVDAAGHSSRIEYDAQGNPTAHIAATGCANRFRYNALGWPIEVMDANQNRECREFDLCGRLRRVEAADGNCRELEYDAGGNVTSLKDCQSEARFAYRAQSCMISRSEGLATQHFYYDSEQRLLAIVNEHGMTYRLERGPLGEVLREVGFDGAERRYHYDAMGRLEREQAADGSITEYVYDRAGRLRERRFADGSAERYGYRADGALIVAENSACKLAFERDLLGRIVIERQSGGQFVKSEYDALDRRVRVQSSLGVTQEIERNALGDVLALRARLEPAVARSADSTARSDFELHFERDHLGLELSRSQQQRLLCRWQRDELGRPVRHELLARDGERVRSMEWTFDNRLQRVVDTQSGSFRYTHDALAQLAIVTRGDSRDERRLPDHLQNLFRREDRGDRRYSPSGQLLEAIDDNGQVTRYAYDPAGNLRQQLRANGELWRYEWDAAGCLSAVILPDGEVVRFAYDALGRRISKHYRGQTWRWLWDGDVPLHEWLDQKPALTWLFEPESFAPVARLSGDEFQDILGDHLGTPLALLDASGARFWSAELDSWGELGSLEGERSTCPFRWPGQYEDTETGLYYNRFRYYDPAAGGYISADPIGLAGGLNAHAYVADPLNSIDPQGLSRSSPGAISSPSGAIQRENRLGTFGTNCLACGTPTTGGSAGGPNITGAPRAAEHIVPYDYIERMRGYSLLTRARRAQLLNDRENFAAICQPCNSSRQNIPYSAWQGLRAHQALPALDQIDSVVRRARVAQVEQMMRRYFRGRVLELLREQVQERC